jgi:glycosyltransferase involved in cell wall biosynthesis
MKNNKILITSPSFNFKENVSGISSIVENIIKNSTFNIQHFQLGSKDGKKKNIKWGFDQINTIFKIVVKLIPRDINVIHLNTALEKKAIFRDSIVLFIGKILGKKIIGHIHGGYYLRHETNNKILIFFIRFLIKKSDVVIVLSEDEKNLLTSRYGLSNFVVIPNAVDCKISENRDIPKYDKLNFLFFGRISKAKGIYTISKSFEYLTNSFEKFTFDIYGAGPDLDDWVFQLKKNKGLNYTYKGLVGGQKIWEVLKSYDIFLLPSEYEGLPMAMLEAMAAGCTVVVSDVGSISSVVVNNINGIILPENSPESLSLVIEDILNQKYDISKIGNKAQNDIYNNFSFTTFIKKIDSLYLSI